MWNYTSLIAWTTSVLFAFFALFLYHGTRRPSTRMFALIGANCSLWALAHGFLYFLGSAPDPDSTYAIRLFLMRVNHWLGSNTGIIFIYLSFFFPEQVAPPTWIRNTLAVIALSIGSIYLFTSGLIQSIAPSNSAVLQYTWTFGPLEPFFYAHFIGSFLLAAGHLLYKYKKTAKEEVRQDIRKLLAAVAGGCIPIVVTTVLLTASGNFEISRFAPTLTALGISFTVLVISRYHILSIRILFAELLMSVLMLILFANVFIPELTLLSFPHSPLSFVNKYAVLNWALGGALLVGAVAGFIRSKTSTLRTYFLVVATTSLWAIANGFAYFTGDPATYDFLVKLTLFLGNSVALCFVYFVLVSVTTKNERKKILPVLCLLHALVAYGYLATDLFVATTNLSTAAVLLRSWVTGPLGIFARLDSILLLAAGFYLLYTRLDQADIFGPAAERKVLFWTSLAAALPAVLLTLGTHIGFTWLYWIVPLSTVGWIISSLYAVSHFDTYPARIICTELAILFLAFLLFGDLFSRGELTSSFMSKTLIFLAFSTVGLFFIRNIIKNEEQEELLHRMSITLADLNKNLKAKVLERTRELGEEEAHLEVVIENLTNGIVEYSNDGVLVRINKAAEQMLGVKRAEVLGKRITDKDREHGPRAALAAVTFTEKNEIAVHEPVEKELQVTRLSLDSTAGSNTLYVLRDVTRENLISRSKSEFISIAAHQLRSPLSVIKWTFSSLLSGDMGRLPLSLESAMHQGSESNQRMINLVNDLLIATRIEGGKFEYRMDDCDAKEIASTAVKNYTEQAHGKAITLELVGAASARPIPLRADREKLLIALGNLLSNAIWYTPAGGTVSLKVSSGKNGIQFAVKDTGIGIPKEERERLFSRFYRSHGALRMNPNGSGLGLYVTQNIAEAHGGEVTLSSTEGRGTTMTITLKES